MSRSRASSVSSYYQQASRIISISQNLNPEKYGKKPLEKPRQRLSFRQIQNITRQMLKDKKAHTNNMGIITNIKGKMYCLKLGEVSKPKDFSQFFYSTQYKKKAEKRQKTLKLL